MNTEIETHSDVVDWNLNRAREWWWIGVPLPMTILYVGAFAYAILTTSIVSSVSPKRRSS